MTRARETGGSQDRRTIQNDLFENQGIVPESNGLWTDRNINFGKMHWGLVGRRRSQRIELGFTRETSREKVLTPVSTVRVK
jgi:hypothetical protein